MSRGAERGGFGRRVGGRPLNQTFLIVCEGTKTEPQYFKAFKLPSVDVYGTGKNTRTLVEDAIRLKDVLLEAEGEARDHYWCVFDRDSFPAQNFNAAIEEPKRAGFRVAYSNEAFEIWYLLHFHYSDAALDRRLYGDKLARCLGHPYAKSDPTIFETLRGRQEQAIKNAGKLLASYPRENPEQNNPSTTVHLLVEQLRARRAAR